MSMLPPLASTVLASVGSVLGTLVAMLVLGGGAGLALALLRPPPAVPAEGEGQAAGTDALALRWLGLMPLIASLGLLCHAAGLPVAGVALLHGLGSALCLHGHARAGLARRDTQLDELADSLQLALAQRRRQIWLPALATPLAAALRISLAMGWLLHIVTLAAAPGSRWSLVILALLAWMTDSLAHRWSHRRDARRAPPGPGPAHDPAPQGAWA